MDRDRIEKLKKIVAEGEQLELDVLLSAYNCTLDDYNTDEKKSAEKLKANRAAKQELERLVEQLENKYLTGAKQLKNLMAALRYLKGEGWKIGKSKLYKDRDRGLFVLNADKSIDESAILAYAAKHLEKTAASGANDEYGKKAEEKIDGEIKYNDLRAQKLQYELDKEKGKHIPRGRWLTELVSKLSASKFVTLKVVQMKAPDLIAAVGGDLKKESMFVELFSSFIEAGYDELARVPELKFRV